MAEYYLQTKDLAVGYQGKALIHDINFGICNGEIVTLIGPNGSGKSTILKSITMQLRLVGGKVFFDDTSLMNISYKELSSRMAVVLTERIRTELMTCHDIVATGRYPYTGRLGILTAEDERIVDEAMAAVHAQERIIAVAAGPGTGKTKTLIAHLYDLIANRKIKPSEITAVTFTNYAAAEMKERLKSQASKKIQINNIQIGTFHAVCMSFLREQGIEFSIIDEAEAVERAKEAICSCSLDAKPKSFLEQLSLKKSGVEIEWDSAMEETAKWYQNSLRERNQMDFDDLLLETLRIIEENESKNMRKRFSYLLVD